MGDYLISLLIFTPLAAALAALCVPAKNTSLFRIITLTTSLFQFVILIIMFLTYEGSGQMQFAEHARWITLELPHATFTADYSVGVDGLSFPLIALSVCIMLIATIASWSTSKNVKGYFILFLILNASIIGTFTALDFLLFYIFFEFMLLPMFFLIGMWGGPRREYASIKFFLYTLLGSILILIVLIGLYTSIREPGTDGLVHSFSLLTMSDSANFISSSIFDPGSPWMIGGWSARQWAFLFLLIGFAIKLPAVPLHTWLPDAHVEAPTPISVILAALLLKVGGYGLIRIAYPIFPEAALYFSWTVALVGVVSILYGALNALASKDLKRMIAYSSVSHMGFVMLGLASVTVEGVTGAVFQMFTHGILSAMLFLIAGVLYDRTHDRTISNYSGLTLKMPVYFVFVLIAFFASLGLPGLAPFIGEVLVLLGAFKSHVENGLLLEVFAILATGGIILSAAYYLWTIQRMFFGPFHLKGGLLPDQITDVNRQEYIVLLPLAVAAIVFGIFPQLMLDYINPFAQEFAEKMVSAAQRIHLKP